MAKGAAITTGRGLPDAVSKRIRFSREEWAAITTYEPDEDRQVEFVRATALEAVGYETPARGPVHGVTDYRHEQGWCGADAPRGNRSTRVSVIDCLECLSAAESHPELVGVGRNA